ncbi:MAG TPA: glycosyltransferase [Xanthobacteraceae bacterium]|nr:glycosyltransferase [Xanthobacteraceae bacterium]
MSCLGLDNPDEPAGSLDVLEQAVDWQLVPGAPRSRLLSLWSGLPMVSARFATRPYRATLARKLAHHAYDGIVFDHYSMRWALPMVQRFARNTPLCIHVAHNSETEVTHEIARNFSGDPIRKLLLARNAAKTRRAEQMFAQSCKLLVTLTEHDSAAFSRLNPDLQTIVLPPGYSGRRQRARELTANVPRRVIIVGSFTWIAKQMNLERFLETAASAFLRHRIEMHVVGCVPEPLEQRLRARFPWVTFRGFVDDLNREFQAARLALVPEETGGGFKLKTLDYIFGRVPVAAIASALNGIPGRLQAQFVLANDLATLVSRIVQVIDDVGRLNALQNGAFALAEGMFDWDANGRRFGQAVEGFLRRARSSGASSGRSADT